MIMDYFYRGAFIALILILTLFIYRVARGPSVFDRLIGLNGISTKAILLLIVLGAMSHNLDMLIDLAIGYGLLNLVGALAVGKFLEQKEAKS